MDAVDQARVEAFAGRALGDAAGAMTTCMCVLGDRLGLFRDLAAHGPATSAELARRVGVNERYAREWLGGMASAGYVTYDASARSFTLPPEHAPVLAEEGGPFFLGGLYAMFPSNVGIVDRLAEAFRGGGGVPQSAYREDFWDGLERFTAGWFENLLLPVWLPAMPAVHARLEAGAALADVGCGHGRAAIKLAQAYPASRFVGYDAFAPAVARAAANAQAAGVAARVRFEVLDAARGLPEQYDVVTTFDVVHDAVDPRGLLRSIRRALAPDGRYVMLEIGRAEAPEENTGPVKPFMYGASLFYCMTTSLAHGGEGLGTLGMSEPRVRELCAEAGFGAVRRVPLENPFNSLYEIAT